MTRKLAVLLLLLTLALAGCNKVRLPWKKGAAATPATASETVPAPTAPTPPGDLAPPSPPDLASAPAAAPAAAPAPAIAVAGTAPAAAAPAASPAATPAPGPAKPIIDKTASAMVLCYHNIEEGSKSKALTISVTQFEQEMEQLKNSGFSVIPMQDFLAWRRGEKNIPKKSCVITIDDGWSSGYTHAWPVLKKHGFPFTMFIYINYVGTGGKSLSWAQLEEMRDAGVDIQCHTYSHSSLKKAGEGMDRTNRDKVMKDVAALGTDGWLRKEIIESKKVLEQKLGIRVNALAYPFGVYTAKARELVKEAGYEAAFTVYGQRLTTSSPFDLLGRYAIDAKQPKVFQSALQMIGGGVSPGEAETTSSVAQLAPAAMVTQPMHNETIQTKAPLIKANLASMGEVEAGTVNVRISGVGLLPNVKYDPATKIMTAQAQNLAPGSYSVIITAKVGGQQAEVRWDFTVASTATAPSAPKPAATPAPAGLPKAPSPPKL